MFAVLSPSDEEEEEVVDVGLDPQKEVWQSVPSLFNMCKTAFMGNLGAFTGHQLVGVPAQMLSDIVGSLTNPLSLSELQVLPSGALHSGVVLGPRSSDQCLQNVTRQPLTRLTVLKNNSLNPNYLRELPNLKDLRLNACPKLALALLQRTAELPREPVLSKLSLHTLHIVDCGLTDANLLELTHFPHLLPTLTSLDLSSNGRLSNESLASLANYSSLTALNVTGTRFSAVEVLLSLEQLSDFNCGFTAMGDSEVELLAHIPRLQSHLTHLSLECTQISEATLPFLATLTALRSLNLSGNKLSSHFASSLEHLTNLETLAIAGTELLTLPDGKETQSFPPTFLSKLTRLLSLDARETCGVFLPEISRLTTVNLAQVCSPSLDAQIIWLEKMRIKWLKGDSKESKAEASGKDNNNRHSSSSQRNGRTASFKQAEEEEDEEDDYEERERKREEKERKERERCSIVCGECRVLSLRSATVSDVFFDSAVTLSFLARVHTLDLASTQITDEVWRPLHQLRALTSLDVSNTAVGQSCKRCVAGKLLVGCPFAWTSRLLPLTTLVACKTQVSPSLLRLHFPPSLTSLDLRKNPVEWDANTIALRDRLETLFLEAGVQPAEQSAKSPEFVPFPSPSITPLPSRMEQEHVAVKRSGVYCGRFNCWQTRPCILHPHSGLQYTRQELLRSRFLPECIHFPLGLAFIQGVTRSRHEPLLVPPSGLPAAT